MNESIHTLIKRLSNSVDVVLLTSIKISSLIFLFACLAVGDFEYISLGKASNNTAPEAMVKINIPPLILVVAKNPDLD